MNGDLDFVASLAMAQRAFAKAEELGLHVAIAILDPGGKPLFLARDPRAGWATGDIAQAKARAALAFRAPPAAMAAVAHATLLQLGAFGSQDLLFAGGADVIEHEGRLIGAMAVSGGPEPQDEICLLAALSGEK